MKKRALVLMGAAWAAAPALAGGQEPPAPELGWIGVQFDVQVTTAPRLGQESLMVTVTDVFRSGPADLGGIRPGDRLVALDGRPLSTYRAWMSYMEGLGTGQTVRVRVARGADERDLTVVTGSRPPSVLRVPSVERVATLRNRMLRTMDSLLVIVTGTAARAGAPTSPSAMRLRVFSENPDREDSLTLLARAVEESIQRVEGGGPPAPGVGGQRLRRVELDEPDEPRLFTPYLLGGPFIFGGARARSLGGELARYFGLREGVLITDVIPMSPAAEIGLRPGDVIVAVNGARVAAVADLHTGQGDSRLPFQLSVVRRGEVLRLQYPD